MNKMRHIESHKGFTLIEFSIVMIISGLVLVAGMDLYKIYLKGQKKSGTYETMDKFNNALSAFYNAQKRYPCPADPTLPESNPSSGLENCILLTPLGSCSGGICKVPGRDTDGIGGPDAVLIGAIPYKTLRIGPEDLNPYDTTAGIPNPVQDDVAICNKAFFAMTPIPAQCSPPMLAPKEPRGALRDTLSSNDALDAWGNRMTYAVTAKLTKNTAGSFDVSYGAVTLQTESGQQLSNPAGSVMWALVSHGEDGNGAYNAYGKMPVPCGTISADTENCNGDSTFVNGIFANVPGANYFDDITYYSISRLSSLWTNAATNTTNGSNEALDITNRNIGNVGVGIPLGATPSQRLEVANKIRAAGNVMSQNICDSSGSNCFKQGYFGGAPAAALQRVCPPPAAGTINVVTKISGGNVQCTAVPIPAAFAAQTCPPGKDMIGVNHLGFIICTP